MQIDQIIYTVAQRIPGAYAHYASPRALKLRLFEHLYLRVPRAPGENAYRISVSALRIMGRAQGFWRPFALPVPQALIARNHAARRDGFSPLFPKDLVAAWVDEDILAGHTHKNLMEPLTWRVGRAAEDGLQEETYYTSARQDFDTAGAPYEFNLHDARRNAAKNGRVFTLHERILFDCLSMENPAIPMALNATRFSMYRYADFLHLQLRSILSANERRKTLSRAVRRDYERATESCHFFRDNIFIDPLQQRVFSGVAVAFAARALGKTRMDGATPPTINSSDFEEGLRLGFEHFAFSHNSTPLDRTTKTGGCPFSSGIKRWLKKLKISRAKDDGARVSLCPARRFFEMFFLHQTTAAQPQNAAFAFYERIQGERVADPRSKIAGMATRISGFYAEVIKKYDAEALESFLALPQAQLLQPETRAYLRDCLAEKGAAPVLTIRPSLATATLA